MLPDHEAIHTLLFVLMTMLLLSCRTSHAASDELTAEKALRREAEATVKDLTARLMDADAARTAVEARASDLTTALADEQCKAASLEQAVHSLKVVREAERQEALKR